MGATDDRGDLQAKHFEARTLTVELLCDILYLKIKIKLLYFFQQNSVKEDCEFGNTFRLCTFEFKKCVW